MQDLLTTLQDRDLGHLRIVAELWGLDSPAGPPPEAAAAIVDQILETDRLEETVEALPPDARAALDVILSQGGRLPWADLDRRFGPLRELGPGRRDREKPWRRGTSALEALWYRGLVARAFDDSPLGLREFGFVPREFQARLGLLEPADSPPFGSPASVPEVVLRASSRSVDDAVTLLAALRRRPADGDELSEARMQRLAPFMLQPRSLPMLVTLLVDLGLLVPKPLQPDPEKVGRFLDSPRDQALAALADAWRRSERWNDLATVPGLTHATWPWPNEPLGTRVAVLSIFRSVPAEQWWDLDSFIEAVKDRQPGFQRTAGEFDSWYLQDAQSGAFLRGFEHWDDVEARLLAYLIGGPLHWLGGADLGQEAPHAPPTSFRLTAGMAAILDPAARPLVETVEGQGKISADGRLTIPRSAARTLRYQLARFCIWQGLEGDDYLFRLNANALQSASSQGLQVGHVQTLLAQLSGQTLPGNLQQALDRYARSGPDAISRKMILVQVRQRSAVDSLRKSPKVSRWLDHPVGDLEFLVEEGNLQQLIREAVRLGVLISVADVSRQGSP